MDNSKKIDQDILENVTGGTESNVISRKKSFCPRCDKDTIFNLYMGGRAICTECNHQKFM